MQQFTTYPRIAPGDSILNVQRKDKLNGGFIVYTADMELKKKGMTVDASKPEALFMFETKLEEKVEYSQSPTLSVDVGYGGPVYYVDGSAPVAGGAIKAHPMKKEC